MKIEFSIRQKHEATDKKPETLTEFNMSISSRKEPTREFVLEQVKGKVAQLLRMRLVTKQTCGISLSKPLEISFEIAGKKINTSEITAKWNFKLKVANTKERRTTFYRTLEEIVDAGLLEGKAVSHDKFDLDINAIVDAQKQARAERKAAKELAARELSVN